MTTKFYYTETDLSNWQAGWKQSQKLSNSEWLEIFKKNIPDLNFKKCSLQIEIKLLKSEAVNFLKKAYRTTKDKFAVWFWELYAETFITNKVDKLEKELKRIEWILTPKRKIKNGVDNLQIEQATMTSWDQFLPVNKNRCLCPFHSEKTPSFFINPKTNRGHCFGCGWSGSAIDYVMQIENINFVSAVKKLT